MAEIPRHVWEGLTAKELAQLAAQAVVEAERAATLAEEAEAYVEAAIYFAEVALKTLNTRRLRLRSHENNHMKTTLSLLQKLLFVYLKY
ncbi:telomere repeat-binding factor 2-like isoform X2 [Lycium barbarum]|uniref:telomere repeat-binding factor 2-like isoform X2 n=1 Tax=Lycium barbarum TaxID=112863 RepID=UPI00293F1661|nr:telomere repeat-binding factor 2-like isoform X2 [Lycium barbarum]